MKKLGKSSKKGFTLVELIVVLVILAVLAAMLVPALTGYINKAREEKEFQAASTVYTAAQALATEEYGKNGYTQNDDKDIDASKITLADIKTLTSLGDKVSNVYVKVSGANITDIAVQFDGGTKVYTYTAGSNTWGAADASTFATEDYTAIS